MLHRGRTAKVSNSSATAGRGSRATEARDLRWSTPPKLKRSERGRCPEPEQAIGRMKALATLPIFHGCQTMKAPSAHL